MKKLLQLFLLLIISTTSLFATDGYYSHGYGIHYKGFAGAGIAFPRSAMIAALNPGALVFLGNRYDFGVALFSPRREYTVIGAPSFQPGTFPLAPGTVSSDKEYFVIPHVAANWMLGDQQSIGFALYGHGGMNTEYPVKTFDNPAAPVTAPTGVNLSQLFSAVSYSRKIGKNHALGISAVLAYQWFKAEGLQAFGFASSDASKLSNNDHQGSFGAGLRIGYLGSVTERLNIGASYTSKIRMSEFDDYSGLFAEQGGFDIPANFSVGLAYEVSDKVTLMFDYKRILYGDVKSIGNPFDPTTISPVLPDGMTPNPNFKALGDDNAAGFGWKDMNVFKLAAEFEASKNWILRAGYSHGDNPISSGDVLFNILAPGVIENHASAGFTRKIGNKELNFAFTYAFKNTVSGPNPLEVPGQQSIELAMNQFDIEIGFSFHK